MSDLFGQDGSRVLMPGQPFTGADAPTSNPSVLAAMLNPDFAPQTAATQHSQDLADALAAMRYPAQDIRTPGPSVADRLADALMQRRYGQSMQGFRQPDLSGLDPPSAGQPDAPAPAPNLIYDAPQMQAGMTGGPQIDSDGELYPADLFASTFGLDPLSSTGYLPPSGAFAPFPIPKNLLSGSFVSIKSDNPKPSTGVNAYLLPPGTPVNALGSAASVELISPGRGNTTIDIYPSQNPTLPKIPAPLLTPGALVRSQIDDYSQASYLVSASGSSTNYSPLTFLPGSIGIAASNPGDTWAGTPLSAGDIAAAKSFCEWALSSWVQNNPHLGEIWNGYDFIPHQSGMNPAQQAFAAQRAALDKQYGWMAVPALLPLAIAAAPTLLSAANTAGAWGGSQASVWAPRIAGGLGLGGAAALRQEEEEGIPVAAEWERLSEEAPLPVGPESPQSALSGNRTYPDPAPTIYEGDISPDTPVKDHNLAQALGGHPTNPDNLDLRAWAENARKGAFEGQYLRDRARLIEGGLTPEQADWVLEGELHWIQTDIHASPVDPTILDRLPSP